ncbi:hypothetical protein GY12_10905 [Micrococcus luteus]|nr:hypothetical protein GY12_10905 [Micrococcus luteus]
MSLRARSWMVSSPRACWPTVRACSMAAAVSRPSVETPVRRAPVFASVTSVTVDGCDGVHQLPAT